MFLLLEMVIMMIDLRELASKTGGCLNILAAAQPMVYHHLFHWKCELGAYPQLLIATILTFPHGMAH